MVVLLCVVIFRVFLIVSSSFMPELESLLCDISAPITMQHLSDQIFAFFFFPFYDLVDPTLAVCPVLEL